MKRRYLLAVVLALLAMSPLPIDAAEVEHVVLISIDGLRPEFYLDPAWPAPMIQQMAREGASATGARGVYPSVTYPTHTSIITSVMPDRHGIHYNSPFEPDGPTGRWYWEEREILTPTLWDAVRSAGGTNANLSWPVSVGAPIDWNLPEIWSITEGETAIEALKRASSPPGLWEEIEREAAGRLTLDNFDIDWITRDDRAGDIAAYLLTTKRPTLMTVHLLGVDHFQHEDGRDSPRVRRALSSVDSAISQIVEAAERADMLATTAFVVTGDHGFIDIDKRLAPNVWLVEAGLLSADRSPGWKAAFHTTAASAFLHLAEPGDQETLRRVLEVLESLPPEERALFEILDRSELDRFSAAPEAALGLALAPGVDATGSTRSPAVRTHGGANHGFLPTFERLRTGFIAWGAGVGPPRDLGEIELLDVAPVVAELLDLELADPAGHLPDTWASDATAPAELASHIAHALGDGTTGERAMVRFDPTIHPDLPAAVDAALAERGIEVELVPYGAVENFAARLEEVDIYIWLPVSEASLAYRADQVPVLMDWLHEGRGRQIHFHWGDGTRATDGQNLEHDATYDAIYRRALDIDYAALDRAQRSAAKALRSGTVRVTTPAGTDLAFEIGERPITLQNGDASRAAMESAVVPIQREIELPAGALRVAPIEASVSGTLVVPWARFGDSRVEDLRLTFTAGRLSEWNARSGGESFAAALEAQPALAWFRELAIGMNPVLVAPPGDERVPYYGYGGGVVRLGLGNNSELGGAVTGTGVRWLFFPEATVEVAGRRLVDGGRLVD